jgi:hypothetical protein
MAQPATPDAAPNTADPFEIIRTTRSMRRLKPDPVPNELIRKILRGLRIRSEPPSRDCAGCERVQQNRGSAHAMAPPLRVVILTCEMGSSARPMVGQRSYLLNCHRNLGPPTSVAAHVAS